MKGVDKRVVYWLAELKDSGKEIRLSEEHLDMRWVNCTNASELANYPEFIKMLGRYDEIIRKCLTKN